MKRVAARRIAVILLLFACVNSSWANDGSPEALVAVSFTEESLGQSPAFENIILDSLRIDFSQHSLVLEPVADQVQDPDFSLILDYTLTGDTVSIDFKWFDPATETPLLVSRSGTVNLLIDQVITSAVEELVESAAPRIEEVLASAPAPATPHEEPAVVEAVANEVVDPVETSVQTVPVRRSPRTSFGAEFGVVLPLGDVAEYFGPGYLPSMVTSWPIELGWGSLSMGAHIGFHGLAASGDYSITQITVVPIGVDLRYVSPGDLRWGFHVRVDGGPAVLITTFSDASSRPLAKVVPYFLGGTGVRYRLADSLFLSAEAAFVMYFEAPSPILGVAPVVQLNYAPGVGQ